MDDAAGAGGGGPRIPRIRGKGIYWVDEPVDVPVDEDDAGAGQEGGEVEEDEDEEAGAAH